MMKAIVTRKKKQNLSKQTSNTGAAFVSTKSDNTKTFKYNFRFTHSKYINEKFIAIKNRCKKIKEMIQLRTNKFDFSAAKSATIMWLMNAFIEGVIVNFAVWGLLGWRFNLITIMAWGFVVKQSLDIYWRLKINGTNTKLPEKH